MDVIKTVPAKRVVYIQLVGKHRNEKTGRLETVGRTRSLTVREQGVDEVFEVISKAVRRA